MTLKDFIGLWVLGESLITHIIAAFMLMFTSASPHTAPQFPMVRQYHRNNPLLEHYQWLSSIPLPEEISRTILSLPPLKVPVLDGYHAIFFQRNWNILGPSIIHVIQEIFETTNIPKDWGTTNLVLILKVSHLDMITQFPPISL